jgi:hypothetical protein
MAQEWVDHLDAGQRYEFDALLDQFLHFWFRFRDGDDACQIRYRRAKAVFSGLETLQIGTQRPRLPMWSETCTGCFSHAGPVCNMSSLHAQLGR